MSFTTLENILLLLLVIESGWIFLREYGYLKDTKYVKSCYEGDLDEENV